MLMSMRLASIFAHEEMHEGAFPSDIQQYFPNKRDSQTLDFLQRSAIIKFLSDNLFVMLQHGPASDVIVKEFENKIIESTSKSIDKDLMTVLRNFGWNGKTFQMSSTIPFDPNPLLLALLNLHLRSTDKEHAKKRASFDCKSERKGSIATSSRKSHDSFECGNEEIHNEDNKSEKEFYFEQVKSFCPSVLLSHLRARPPGQMLSVSSSVFMGACLLADISGEIKCNEIVGFDKMKYYEI